MEVELLNKDFKEDFEKRMYVYRRSSNDYQHISIFLTVLKFIFSASGISGFFYLPLSALSIIAGLIDVIEKSLNVVERKETYSNAYKFYKQTFNLYKARLLSEQQVLEKEQEFVERLTYFPREKYIKEMKLNGYNFRNI